MQLRTISRRRAALAALAAVLAAACSDSTSPNARGLTLSFIVPSNHASAALASSGSAAFTDVAAATQSLVLSKVQLVVEQVELNSRAGDAECDDDEDECEGGCDQHASACSEITTGPLLIDLPVGGDLLSPVVAQVAPGTYDELEFKLGLPHDNGSLASFLSAHPQWPQQATVHVTGTFDAGDGKGAQPFDIFFPARGRFELDFNPPLVVDAQHSAGNVTLTIDVISWFHTPSGGLINPLLLSSNETLRMQVVRNIRRSLHAFRDDNRDGDDDHHG